MKTIKKTILFFLLLFCVSFANAQIQTLELNKKYQQFNNGAKLPAESNFMVNSSITGHVSLVSMQINNKDFKKGDFLYEAVWKRSTANETVASLMSNFKLRQNAAYSFKFTYYRTLTAPEREEIKRSLLQTCDAFLQANINKVGTSYTLEHSPKSIWTNLNAAVAQSMSFYRQPKQFAGKNQLSELIYLQLVQTAKRKTEAGLDTMNNVASLKTQIANELNNIVNKYEYVIDDELEIIDYSTEKISGALALNLGYGGIYDSGNIDDLNYFDAPYAGLSFAFGKKAFNSPFWSNTSMSAGVFLKNFKPNAYTKISGPVVGLPLYAALGHKFFNYFKVNAGATILEEQNLSTQNNSIYVRPFIGLSVELYLWLGFQRKN